MAETNRDYAKFQAELVEREKKDGSDHHQRGEAMRRQLESNLGAIEKERLEKTKQLTKDCSKDLAEYDARIQDEQAKMKEKHVEQHTTYMDKLRIETEPRAPRWSQEYFRLRKTEDKLFLQKRYPEAQERKAKAEALEKIEQAGWEQARNNKIKMLEEPFLQKQQQTVANHEKRSQAARMELLRKQTAEKEKLQKLFDSKKKHVEEQHQFAMRKHEIYVGSTLSFANSLVIKKSAEVESRVWSVP